MVYKIQMTKGEVIHMNMTHHCDIINAGDERWRFKNRDRFM